MRTASPRYFDGGTRRKGHSKTMAIIDVKDNIKKEMDGILYTAKYDCSIQINLKDLDLRFKENTENRIIFEPANPEAARELYRLFPPEKWEYRYYTVKEYYGREKKSRPYLYLDINDGLNCIFLDIWEMTEEDYKAIRKVYCAAIPKGNIMTAHEYLTYLLDCELLSPDTTDSPMNNGLAKRLRVLPKADYLAIRSMIFNRRKEYTEGELLDYDYNKLYDVINDELVKSLLERARSRTPLEARGNND